MVVDRPRLLFESARRRAVRGVSFIVRLPVLSGGPGRWPMREGNPMSDFYRRRRVVIKDATALLTFFLGFVWSGAFVWPFLADQVDQGDMIRGLAYFLALVLGTGIVTGLIGLEAGNLLGGVWERYHKHHRGNDGLALAGGSAAPARRDLSNVYYDEAGVYAASFIPLAERVRPFRYEMAKAREALAKTTNIGAWDGGRLVGAVRVLS